MIESTTDTEKTQRVKIAIALMAKKKQHIKKTSDLYLTKTNIQECIERLQELT